jgi:hypothetical protein
MTDARSPLTAKIVISNPDAYRALTIASPTPQDAHSLLDGVTAQQLLTAPLKSDDAGQSLLAALWLWLDGLHESHAIVQNSSSETAAFWHAIMHRREGDFSNSKYWYARCANHPVLPVISAQAGPILNPLPADKSIMRLTHQGWNQSAFVDLVEQVHEHTADPKHELAVTLQRLEWRVLFDYCLRAASTA